MVFDDMTDEEIIAMTEDETQPAIQRMDAWLHSSDRGEIHQIMHDVVADYATLEVERDELKRRCAKIATTIREYSMANVLDARIIAIAEGRDNG